MRGSGPTGLSGNAVGRVNGLRSRDGASARRVDVVSVAGGVRADLNDGSLKRSVNSAGRRCRPRWSCEKRGKRLKGEGENDETYLKPMLLYIRFEHVPQLPVVYHRHVSAHLALSVGTNDRRRRGRK